MDRIVTERAPTAIGPYSQAIRQGEWIFTSGQIPIDPATSALVDGDFDAKARQVFENLRAVLQAAGADFGDVVKATVYLTDLGDFQALNAVYAEYFADNKPARSTVGVAQLPLGSPVEIDLVAHRG
ncbi:MAG TPA: RidA family protein [Thermoanaerobaculia bacterium]|nr:RidA family protein [Thermoanaerobaculia bacterium]